MTPVLTREDRYLPDFQALERSPLAQGPAWLQTLRAQAFARFTELGFPTASRGNEKWKYTSVVPIARSVFKHSLDGGGAAVTASDLRGIAPWDDGWTTLAFINGRFAPALSTAPAQAHGIRVTSLAEALATHPEIVKENLARYAAFDDDAFIALNTAFLLDGAFIHLPDDAVLDSPLHLLFVTTGKEEPTVSYPRTLVVAGRHSRLTIIESYVSRSPRPYFTDAVVEIALGEGAQVQHYRFLQEGEAAVHLGMTRVSQGQGSAFTSTSFSRGAALARNDIHVLLDAPGGTCTLHGLYVTSGAQHMDNHINIDHAKPHTTSREYFKGILDGKSRAVFSGRVVVWPGAIKADAKQTDKNLILSEGAEVDSTPSLEIYADDVQCGHGATAGRIDEETLFYMRSRGLDHETASKLLIYAFVREIIETVQVEAFRAYLDRLFLSFSETLPSLQFGRTPQPSSAPTTRRAG